MKSANVLAILLLAGLSGCQTISRGLFMPEPVDVGALALPCQDQVPLTAEDNADEIAFIRWFAFNQEVHKDCRDRKQALVDALVNQRVIKPPPSAASAASR